MSYATTHEHLRAELDRIETVIGAHDIDGSLADDAGSTPAVDEPSDPSALSLTVAAETRQSIREHTEAIRQQCHDSDSRLRLRVLAEVCGLSRRHLDVLMLALAPVLDTESADRFERANNNRSLGQPTPEYIKTLFGRTPSERLAAGRLINRNSPLRTHDLIELHTPPNGAGRANQPIVPSERVVEYLSGDDSIDPQLVDELGAHAEGEGVVDCEADTPVGDLAVSDEISERVARLAAEDDPIRCYWFGPASEKERAIEAVVDGGYIKADLRAVLQADALEWLCREAALLGRPLHLTTATPAINDSETTTSLSAVFEACEDLQTDLIVTGSESWTPTETLSTDLDAIIKFPYPSVDRRQAFWNDHAAELPDDLSVDVVAGTFRLTRDQLQAALSTARTLADGELTVDHVYAGCRAQSTDELDELADRIEPDSSWDEIQLSDETERKLRLVRTHITQQAKIYTEWGFGEQFSHGTGVVALFEGPSGTGKTMAAELLAGEVGMDLFRIDLSSVVSKYIGETEQKLEAIFEAATNANAILLFDEADAVFGDRTEVSDSTDRYANAEVNYLLQRIERYDGVVLLTTNYASQIDSAFERRLDHTVSFKKPQQDTRTAIWSEMIPDQAPLGEVDYDFLSSFEFTGGQIKTIAQTAAILAADDASETRIEMPHLVEAIQLATEKSGRMVDPADYEPYDHLLYDGHQPTLQPADREAVNETAETAKTAETTTNGTASPPASPESVVRMFFDRLDRGDPAVDELYHPNAVVDRISQKELRRAQQTEGSIMGELQCVQDDPSRVRIECIRKTGGSTTPVSVELRREGDEWRLFDLSEPRPQRRTNQ